MHFTPCQMRAIVYTVCAAGKSAAVNAWYWRARGEGDETAASGEATFEPQPPVKGCMDLRQCQVSAAPLNARLLSDHPAAVRQQRALGAHNEKFLAQQVKQGHFGSASEAIRAGLRLLEEREARVSLLRRALLEGEESGTADYSFDGLMAEIDSEGSI